MSPSNFKVIVVGGGPVGLTAAHALEKAGIDFTLLEQRSEAVIDAGSNLVLLPNGMQGLAELGLAEGIDAVSTPLNTIDRMDHRNRDLGSFQVFELMKEYMGVYPRVISRHDLTKVLYDNLTAESQSKVLTTKRLASIDTLPEGVRVTCVDGTSYSGSMVIGADGAHSKVREQMRSLAVEYGSAEVNAEKPFLTTYRAIWIRMPMDARLKPGMTCETHGVGAATQFFAGEDSAVLGLYEPLEQPTRDRQRYTAADEEALVRRWDSLPLIPGGALTLGEAYRARIEAGMVSLEEGVLDHWSWAGRIVLAGDAAHKFTPSTGAGCNTGMIDVLTLVNELHATMQAAGPAALPSRTDIAQTFQKYQAERIAPAQAGCARSGQATATATWATSIGKFVDCYIMSVHAIQRYMASSSMKKAVPPTFKFLTQRPAVAAC